MRSAAVLAIFCTVLAGPGCGSSGSGSGGSGGSAAGSGGSSGGESFDAGAAGSDAGAAGSRSDADAGDAGALPACDAYIACVSQTTPAGLAPVLAAYGKGGSCWAQGNPTLCTSACRTGTIAAHQAFPDEEACNVCSSSADCPSQEPACDTSAERCVSCLADSDCSSPSRPACDTATHSCVQCTKDAQCTDPALPFCDSTTHACVACTTDSDCNPLMGGLVCDPTSHRCRGCQSDSECSAAAPHCSGTGACVQCVSDADCSPSAPHCASGACVACTTDAECAPGICSAAGTCCGADYCAQKGLDCGSAFDTACALFRALECGSCPSGDTCVLNHCEPTPNNTCRNSSCACVYVPENNDYECVPSSGTCTESTDSCSPGFTCTSSVSSAGNKYYACSPDCLSDSDCRSGNCKLMDGPNSVGTCQ